MLCTVTFHFQLHLCFFVAFKWFKLVETRFTVAEVMVHSIVIVSRCVRFCCASTMNRLNFPMQLTRRMTSTEAVSQQERIPSPPLDGTKIYEPKIVNIVDNISKLTLREVADLNELLKTTLNIQDIAVAAPVAQGVAAAKDESQDEEKTPEKDEFAVKLTGFNATDKIKLIKALKIAKPDLNLVQAKKFVESVPQVLVEHVSKEESENIKKTLEEAGGKVEIV